MILHMLQEIASLAVAVFLILPSQGQDSPKKEPAVTVWVVAAGGRTVRCML